MIKEAQKIDIIFFENIVKQKVMVFNDIEKEWNRI